MNTNMNSTFQTTNISRNLKIAGNVLTPSFRFSMQRSEKNSINNCCKELFIHYLSLPFVAKEKLKTGRV